MECDEIVAFKIVRYLENCLCALTLSGRYEKDLSDNWPVDCNSRDPSRDGL